MLLMSVPDFSDPALICSRRRFLLACLGLTAVGGSCALLEDTEMEVAGVDTLRRNGYVITEFNGDLIFTAWADSRPYTLSLICTHKACTVEFYPDQQQFICPCHKGRFDPRGRVISGKPRQDLHRFRTEIRADKVWVLNQPPED